MLSVNCNLVTAILLAMHIALRGPASQYGGHRIIKNQWSFTDDIIWLAERGAVRGLLPPAWNLLCVRDEFAFKLETAQQTGGCDFAWFLLRSFTGMVTEQLIGVCFNMSNIYIMQPVNISHIFSHSIQWVTSEILSAELSHMLYPSPGPSCTLIHPSIHPSIHSSIHPPFLLSASLPLQ